MQKVKTTWWTICTTIYLQQKDPYPNVPDLVLQENTIEEA